MRRRGARGLLVRGALALSIVYAFASGVGAEPFLAVQTGYKCMVCHVNPTGGGKRTEFGNIWAQTELPKRTIRVLPDFFEEAAEEQEPPTAPPARDEGEDAVVSPALRSMFSEALDEMTSFEPGFLSMWNGSINDHFAVGGDFRAGGLYRVVPHEDDDFSFRTNRALLYAQFDLIPGLITLYLDEQVAPGGATNREAWGMLKLFGGRLYAKGGRLFLPYGWRLQDDTAFIRAAPGINYNTPDDGVEVGVEWGPVSFQAAFTNGTAGGAEIDRGKQYSLYAAYTRPDWRVGASWNFNDAGREERMQQNLFAGFRTGRVFWLAEGDFIVDDGAPEGRRESYAVLGEANVLLLKGHYLKLTYEFLDPDTGLSHDEQDRFSAVLEVFPIQFVHARLGYRIRDGIPQNDQQNAQDVFFEFHLYF